MGRNNYFQFKKFTVVQEKSAMKVGTDGVLLGAWINPGVAETILDVGTGTGLIALMLAQRSEAEITAIEIEKNAAGEASENVARSPWKERIKVVHAAFQEFSETNNQAFGLIVSNPPYFSNALKSSNTMRSVARHDEKLPFYKLVQGARKLLRPDGRLAVILPVPAWKEFSDIAGFYGLFPIRILRVKPAPEREPNRILCEFGTAREDLTEETLTILNIDGKSYSDDYKRLTRDFYLNF